MSLSFTSIPLFFAALSTSQCLYLILAYTWLICIFELYLDYRNYKKKITITVVPNHLQSMIDQSTFSKASLYSIDKLRFGVVKQLYSQSEQSLFLVFSIYSIWWTWSKSIEISIYNYFSSSTLSSTSSSTSSSMLQCIIFLSISIIYDNISGLPWSLYHTFVLEQSHGFNKQTLGFFIKDKLKSLVLTIIFLPVFMALLVMIIEYDKQYFFIYAWLVYGCWMLDAG